MDAIAKRLWITGLSVKFQRRLQPRAPNSSVVPPRQLSALSRGDNAAHWSGWRLATALIPPGRRAPESSSDRLAPARYDASPDTATPDRSAPTAPASARPAD